MIAQLRGTTALVTGASGALGRTIVALRRPRPDGRWPTEVPCSIDSARRHAVHTG